MCCTPLTEKSLGRYKSQAKDKRGKRPNVGVNYLARLHVAGSVA